MYIIWRRIDKNDALPTPIQRQVWACYSNAHHNDAQSSSSSPLWLGATTASGSTSVQIDAFRNNRLHAATSRLWTRNAAAHWLRDTAAGTASRHSNFANNVVEDLEWFDGFARKVFVLQHRRSKGRYNERVVEQLYAPGAFVRVYQQGLHFVSTSKLVPSYSDLFEIVKVRRPVIIFRKLDSHSYLRRTKTHFPSPLFDHNIVRLSTAPDKPYVTLIKSLALLCPRCWSTIVLQFVAPYLLLSTTPSLINTLLTSSPSCRAITIYPNRRLSTSVCRAFFTASIVISTNVQWPISSS